MVVKLKAHISINATHNICEMKCMRVSDIPSKGTLLTFQTPFQPHVKVNTFSIQDCSFVQTTAVTGRHHTMIDVHTVTVVNQNVVNGDGNFVAILVDTVDIVAWKMIRKRC